MQQRSDADMRILVVGGYGLIGLEATRRLARSHQVNALGRSPEQAARTLPEATWVKADIARLDTPEKWAPLLVGVDAVVNASGALQDGVRDNLTAVQDVAIRALIRACETVGVKRFVQISAPGADGAGVTDFLRTKALADAALKQSRLDWVILRPGLVWGRTASGGTALVRMLAALPLVQILILADARVQMVDIDDVSDAIAAAVDGKIEARVDADLVEAAPSTLGEIVAKVRAWHGYPTATRIDAPGFVGRLLARGADLAGWLGWRSPLRSTSLRALERGVVGDASAWTRASGMGLIGFDESLQRRPATRQDRVFARTQLLLPFIVLVLSAFWIVSGAIGLAQQDEAVAALNGAVSNPVMFVVTGSIVDIALGVALLWRPWARRATWGMIVVTAVYVMASSILTPHLWADPLGPLLKALPGAMLALVCAALLEER
jgi:uncharacterized protein YbjT (DUF2867 family)